MPLDDVPVHHAAPAQKLAVHAPDRLMECFESLGFGCEIGIVQRFCGAEPLGLFRFASLPYRHLLHLLRTRLADLDDPELVTVGLRTGEEWWGFIKKFEIHYHTGKSSRTVPESEALRGERQRIAFLKRKFLEQLDEPDKIFARREVTHPRSDMQPLFDLLRTSGPHDLLWINKVSSEQDDGKTELVEDGLVWASVSRVWPNAAPSAHGVATWLRIAEQTLHLLQPAKAASLQMDIGATNPLSSSNWIKPPVATAEANIAPINDNAGPPVMTHRLLADTTRQTGFVLQREVSGFAASRLYVASADIWVPGDFEGTIEIAFPHTQSNRIWPASMGARNCWQRICTNLRCPEGRVTHSPGILAIGKAGSQFQSKGWRIEPGVVPGNYLNDV